MASRSAMVRAGRSRKRASASSPVARPMPHGTERSTADPGVALGSIPPGDRPP